MSSLTLEVVSASCSEILTKLSDTGVLILDVAFIDALTMRFRILRVDFSSVKEVLKKYDASCKVVKRGGIYWSFCRLMHRPVLLAGIAILLFLVLYLPSRILFVTITGNQQISGETILETAEQCGIRFGASRRQIRSERVKNMLLEKIPDLQWAAVNTQGCLAVVTVREKMPVTEDHRPGQYSNIVASQDGVVTDMTVLNGTALVKPGQAVSKGQTLISGYGDYGLLVKATGAEGEVTAQTIHQITAQIPTEHTKRIKLKNNVDRYSLLVGKKLINFSKDSGIYPSECVRMYMEYYLILPGGFRLPVSLIKESCQYYDIQTVSDDDVASYQWMEDDAQVFVLNSMLGGEIVKQLSRFDLRDGVCRYDSTYICHEMISRIHYEEILQQHE